MPRENASFNPHLLFGDLFIRHIDLVLIGHSFNDEPLSHRQRFVYLIDGRFVFSEFDKVAMLKEVFQLIFVLYFSVKIIY